MKKWRYICFLPLFCDLLTFFFAVQRFNFYVYVRTLKFGPLRQQKGHIK
jgi:hypothetical protein